MIKTESTAPLLSVIVPIYNVEEYIGECLDSIDVSTKDISAEILLIDDGSTDGSSRIAREYADRVLKFKYFRKENGGPSETRNFGVAKAAGKYISFIDADDIISGTMYTNMIGAAEYHDADLTTINVARFNSQTVYESNLHAKVFNDLNVPVTHIRECDNLIYDTTSTNKLIRRSFWMENGFKFPVGWIFEDMPVTLAMNCMANKVAIVHEIGYMWREREGQTKSFTQDYKSSLNLRHRLRMLDDMFEYINSTLNGDRRIYELLRYKAFTTDLMVYIRRLPYMPKATFNECSGLILDFYNRYITDDTLEKMPLSVRQSYEYFLSGDRTKIGEISKYKVREYENVIYVEDGDDVKAELPEGLFTLRDMSIKNDLRTIVPQVECSDVITGPHSFDIYVRCWFPKVNIRAEEGMTSGTALQNIATGEWHRLSDLGTTGHMPPGRERVYDGRQSRIREYDYGKAVGFRLDLSSPDMQEISPGRYMIAAPYSFRMKKGSIFVYIPDRNIRNRLDGRMLAYGSISAKISFDARDQLILTVDAEAKPSEGWPLEPYNLCPAEDGECLLAATKSGDIKVIRSTQVAMAEEMTADGEDVRIKVRSMTDISRASKVSLVYYDILADREAVLAYEGPLNSDSSGTFTFGFCMADKSVSKDMYEGVRELELVAEYGNRVVKYPVYAGCMASCTAVTDEFFAYFSADDRNRLILEIKRRLPKVSQGYIKYMRNHVYPEMRDLPLDEKCILFESYSGEQYSCNPRALYEYIDRYHPEYTCIWALNDEKIPVSGKAVRIRRYSPEYYRYFSTAKFLVNNGNFDITDTKKKGQIEIQTMHGTPYKMTGLDLKEEFRSSKKTEKFIKRNHHWNYLIVQGIFSEKLAWRWFRFTKDFLRTGYPRTDGLINLTEEERSDVRRRFGIPDDKKVLLYAPSCRVEDPEYTVPLDLDYLRKELGDEYVLLIRYHHFDAKRFEVPEDKEFLFDMGRYSRIDDILKAADMLITDYSSVMFDFALTERPEIFFAHDLEEYIGKIRGCYFDLEEEAPGPVVRDTEELVNAVRRIAAGGAEEYRDRRQAFRRKYLNYEDGNSCEKIFAQVFEAESMRADEQIKRESEQEKARSSIRSSIWNGIKRLFGKR